MRAWLLFLILISFARSSAFGYTPQATDSKVVYSGLNVTQTANVYPVKRCTIGTQLLGCGITNELTLATSPWLDIQYNMYNANLRYQLSERENLSRALQLSYFKTYDTHRKLPDGASPNDASYDPYFCYYLSSEGCFTGYDMDAAWLYFAQSEKISPQFTFHWNVQAAYYWNDRKPFSLRRPQIGTSPWQFNLMTAYEFHMTGPWFLQTELGILGVTRKYPPFHTSATVSYRARNIAIQVGFSATGALQAWLNRDREDYHSAALSTNEGLKREFTEDELKKDFSIHPELFLQYFFDL